MGASAGRFGAGRFGLCAAAGGFRLRCLASGVCARGFPPSGFSGASGLGLRRGAFSGFGPVGAPFSLGGFEARCFRFSGGAAFRLSLGAGSRGFRLGAAAGRFGSGFSSSDPFRIGFSFSGSTAFRVGFSFGFLRGLEASSFLLGGNLGRRLAGIRQRSGWRLWGGGNRRWRRRWSRCHCRWRRHWSRCYCRWRRRWWLGLGRES